MTTPEQFVDQVRTDESRAAGNKIKRHAALRPTSAAIWNLRRQTGADDGGHWGDRQNEAIGHVRR
jgi:hypothetical protein